MFTAIIAQKEYIDKVSEYKLFLKPFLDRKDVAFCEWNTDGERFSEMLPSLPEIVGRRKEWRAVVICDESGLGSKNPFDLVRSLPEPFSGTIIGELDEGNYAEYEEYRKNEHNKKLCAYEEAAKNPLTRIATFFCDGPTVTMPESLLSDDPAYPRYIAEIQKKEELRKTIKGDEVLLTSQPTEVICVAKRTLEDMREDYEVTWSTHNENEYSRFYDRNMYFDRMRYLVFDILPRTQRNYSFDYVRFLYATMLLASNDIPFGSLSPNRIYNLDCETDETALRELLCGYEAKLDLTKVMLEQRISELQSKRPARLTDREAESIFCAKVSIPVTFSEDVDRKSLYVPTKGIGLSDGCPADECVVWDTGYKNSKKALHNMLKQIRRSLKRAATDCRTEDNADLTKIGELNEFQIDDVREHIGNEELSMLSVPVPDIYDEDLYVQRLSDDSKEVKKKIEQRMSRSATVAISCIAVLLFALGFFTMFWMNSDSGFFNMSATLIITASAVGAFMLVALIALFFLRHALIKRFKQYNRTAQDISNEIDGAMASYSMYLGHVCNIRRGFMVLNKAETHEDPDKALVILYRKHIIDIETAKASAKEIFGHYMVDNTGFDASGIFEYDYNFERPVEYIYPFPFTDGKVRTIDFIYSGNKIEVPVDFVRNITVRREEIYE